ncbi:Stf0 family sulfotransferase [Lysobacter humi (ex Lee et al. 2017)]
MPEVYPDEHAFEIRNQFARTADGSTPVALQPCKVVFICFTNRCGSNFLAQAIASDGQLRQADEFMCWDVVRALADRNGLRSLEEYLNWLARDQMSPSGYFACKVSLSQLLLLYEEGVLDQWASDARFVHVYRDDIIGQAASLNVAWHTKRWTSEDKGIEAQVPYDPEQMFGIARSIALRNAYFPLVFELMGIEALRVRYEDFVADPTAGTRRVGEFLGLPTLRYEPHQVSYRKQAGDTNRDLVRRLREHYRLKGLGLGAPVDANPAPGGQDARKKCAPRRRLSQPGSEPLVARPRKTVSKKDR